MINKTMKFAIAGVLVVIILLAAVLLPVGFVYGWFTGNKTIEIPDVPTGSFKVVSRLYFEDSDYTMPGDKIVPINLHDPLAANHISKFRLDVSFEGEIEAVMRTKLNLIWTKKLPNGDVEYPRMAAVDFIYDSTKFANNMAVDSAYYYCDSSDRANIDYVLKKGELRTFNIISGLKTITAYDESLSLDIFVESQIVQKNRWQEIWRITSLPLPVLQP